MYLAVVKRLLDKQVKDHILLEGLTNAGSMTAHSERHDLATHSLIRVGPSLDSVKLEVTEKRPPLKHWL